MLGTLDRMMAAWVGMCTTKTIVRCVLGVRKSNVWVAWNVTSLFAAASGSFAVVENGEVGQCGWEVVGPKQSRKPIATIRTTNVMLPPGLTTNHASHYPLSGDSAPAKGPCPVVFLH